jgi:hypothetical protein
MREYAVVSGYTIDNLLDKNENPTLKGSVTPKQYKRPGGFYNPSKFSPTEINLFFVVSLDDDSTSVDAVDIMVSDIKAKVMRRTSNPSLLGELQIYDEWTTLVGWGDMNVTEKTYQSAVFNISLMCPSGRWYSTTTDSGTHTPASPFVHLALEDIDTPVRFSWDVVNGIDYYFSGGINAGSMTIKGTGIGTITVDTESGRVTFNGVDHRHFTVGICPRIEAATSPVIGLGVSSGATPTLHYEFNKARVFH